MASSLMASLKMPSKMDSESVKDNKSKEHTEKYSRKRPKCTSFTVPLRMRVGIMMIKKVLDMCKSIIRT